MTEPRTPRAARRAVSIALAALGGLLSLYGGRTPVALGQPAPPEASADAEPAPPEAPADAPPAPPPTGPVASHPVLPALLASPAAALPAEATAAPPATTTAPTPTTHRGAGADAHAGAGDGPRADSRPFAAAGEVIEIIDRLTPGSTHEVGAAELERFEHDDIHKVLSAVPGVYIREEDGYGLRPNIGMRGSGSERSAKIALMEDGVLIAPAPYSAPAAYYFPLVTRMTRVEVVKGPSAIVYGPNTVGGALNLISRPVPRARAATLDVAVGEHLYGKLHASAAESGERWGVMVEGLKLYTEGFKQLDGGGNTGFDKNDVVVKLRASTAPNADIYQQVELKAGYSDEVSNETYTGLADEDFARTPYRRYAGTQLDRMAWDHTSLQATHELDVPAGAGRLRLTTTLYRNSFTRTWRKLNRFAASDVADVLASPGGGNNAIYYAILTGEADTTDATEALMIGTNQREFLAQGAQLAGHTERTIAGAHHALSFGVRYHADEARRLHTEDEFWMTGGRLASAGSPTLVALDATGAAQAWAVHAQDKVRIGRLAITAGVRGELVTTAWTDRGADAPEPGEQGEPAALEGSYSVVIPGAGVTYGLSPAATVLVGVHKGFVPVSPGQLGGQPEESLNYEAGVRLSGPRAALEVIGFFSDYENLVGTCSFSTGCMTDQIDREFSGGAVHVLGAELMAVANVRISDSLEAPLKLAYTFNRATFQTGFTSQNPQWGTVRAGDELPYLPAHQLSLQAGVAGARWELAASGRVIGAMRDVPGQSEPDPDEQTDAVAVVDVAASVAFGAWGRAYVTIDNALDRAYVVSRRPFGARPGVPRLVVFGYKNKF